MLLSLDEIQNLESKAKTNSDISLAPISGTEPNFKELKEVAAPISAEEALLPETETLKSRKAMIAKASPEPDAFALERTIGKNDSVYSNFCELILSSMRKVGRIVIKSGSERGYATGFMVSERLLLTNHHVFEKKEWAEGSEVQFFHELYIDGVEKTKITFAFTPDEFFDSYEPLDYALVAVNPLDITGTFPLSSIGHLFLDPQKGKLGDPGKEYLNIIHHPGGDYKQLSIRENKFVGITDQKITYETDTAQGSSGSPVFNDQWQVVALHHSGVASKSGDGKHYLDKWGKIIEPVNGKIEESRVHWVSNAGIRISVILEDVFSKHKGTEIINGLKKSETVKNNPQNVIEMQDGNLKWPGPGAREMTGVNEQKTDNQNGSTDVRVFVPAALLLEQREVTVSVRVGASENPAYRAKTETAAGAESAFALEGAKMDRESQMSYSACKGYNPKFLGTEIPLPKPKAGLKRFIARINGTDQTELKYYHYSVLFHSVRMQPAIAAINVDGRESVRKDQTKRVDDWLRDNRLDFDIQLTDGFYRNSGLQKGHMARREDANWGPTAEKAKLFADFTCRYTNACPQVGELNQDSRDGLWGRLEKVVLEEGAGKERGREAKITVFNGPIFSDVDPVYKGIQIPMDFFKIILWIDDGGVLRASGFKLSQSGLMGEVRLEEALDLDQNIEFKPYRCRISEIEKLTGLELSYLGKYDTYKTGAEEREMLSEKEIF